MKIELDGPDLLSIYCALLPMADEEIPINNDAYKIALKKIAAVIPIDIKEAIDAGFGGMKYGLSVEESIEEGMKKLKCKNSTSG